MMSLVNKSVDWIPNYHKILILFPTKSLKSLRAARIDELADSNEPAITDCLLRKLIHFRNCNNRQSFNTQHFYSLSVVTTVKQTVTDGTAKVLSHASIRLYYFSKIRNFCLMTNYIPVFPILYSIRLMRRSS